MQPLQPSAMFGSLGVFVLSICDQRVHEGGVRVSLLVLLPRSGPAPQQEAAQRSPESHPGLCSTPHRSGKVMKEQAAHLQSYVSCGNSVPVPMHLPLCHFSSS